MSGRTTAVLFGLLLLLGGYVYWQSRQEATPEATPTPAAPATNARLLPALALDDTRRIDVTRAEDGLTASFSRDGAGQWRQTVPVELALTAPVMDNAANSLLNLTSRRALSPDANPLAAYGLDNPAYEVVVAVAADETRTLLYTLSVGDSTPAGDAYYVIRQGDPRVFIVPTFALDSVFDLLDNPPEMEPEPEPLDEEAEATPLPIVTLTPTP